MNQEESRLLDVFADDEEESSNTTASNSTSVVNCMKEEVFATDEVLQHVPTRSGLLFYVGSKVKDLTVRGIEIRIRSSANLDGNLHIQVFASNQTYDENYLDPAAFTKIADAQLVPHPDDPDRALIPAYALTPLFLPRLTRTTLFFRASGPWLDYTLNAMTQSKEQAVSGNRMVVFAGNPVSLDTPSGVIIPQQLDSSLASIFSGKFYMELERDNCGPELKPHSINTEVEFVHVVNSTLAATDYRSIEEQVNMEVDRLLLNDITLAQYAGDYNLKMPHSSKAFLRKIPGKCIDSAWETCNYVVTLLTFKHYESLSPGKVKQAVYRNAKSFTNIIESRFQSHVGFHYLGYEPVQGKFKFTLEGVPHNQKMDDGQVGFVSEQVKNFLNDQFPDIYAEVFDVTFEEQKVWRRRLAQGDSGSIELSGTIAGGQIAPLENADFATRVDETFRNASTTFYSSIKYNVHLPGIMSQDQRYKFFEGLSGIKSSVTPDDSAIQGTDPACSGCSGSSGSGNPQSENSDSSRPSKTMLISIGAAAVVLVLIVLACTVRFCIRRKRISSKENSTEKKALEEEGQKNVIKTPDKIYITSDDYKTQATSVESIDSTPIQGSVQPPPRRVPPSPQHAAPPPHVLPRRPGLSYTESTKDLGKQPIPSRPKLSRSGSAYKLGGQPVPSHLERQPHCGSAYEKGKQSLASPLDRLEQQACLGFNSMLYEQPVPSSAPGEKSRRGSANSRRGQSVPPVDGQRNLVSPSSKVPLAAPPSPRITPHRDGVQPIPPVDAQRYRVPASSQAPVAPPSPRMTPRRDPTYVQGAQSIPPVDAQRNRVSASSQAPVAPPSPRMTPRRDPTYGKGAQPTPPAHLQRQKSFQRSTGLDSSENFDQPKPPARQQSRRSSAKPGRSVRRSAPAGTGAASQTPESSSFPPPPLNNPWEEQHDPSVAAAQNPWDKQPNPPTGTKIQDIPLVVDRQRKNRKGSSRRGSLVAAHGSTRESARAASLDPVFTHTASNEASIRRKSSSQISLSSNEAPIQSALHRNSSSQISLASNEAPVVTTVRRNSSSQISLASMKQSQNHEVSYNMFNYRDMQSQSSLGYGDIPSTPVRRGSNQQLMAGGHSSRRFSNQSIPATPYSRGGSNQSIPATPYTPSSTSLSVYTQNTFDPSPSPLHAPVSRRESASYRNLLIPPPSPLHAPVSKRESASYSKGAESWSPIVWTSSQPSPYGRLLSPSKLRTASSSIEPPPLLSPSGRGADPKNSMTHAVLDTTSPGNPSFTRDNLMRMTVRDLKGLLPHDDKFQPVDKKDLVDHLIEVRAVGLISCFTPWELQQMSVAQLRNCLREAGVQYDTRFVVEKRDMIRVFQASGKLRVVPQQNGNIVGKCDLRR